jgi:ketosteroid isomerase-like protein
MKKYLYSITAALLATASIGIAGPETDAIMTKEKAAWQAFKEKKGDDFKKIIHTDFRGLYAEGSVDMAAEVKDMQKWDMKSFAISDFKASSFGDVVVTTYVVTIEGTMEGKDRSGTFNAGSVWKKDKSDWLAIFHTNIKAETPAK